MEKQVKNKEKVYNHYIDFHWWTGIEKRNVHSWLQNFDSNTRWIGEFILDNLIFYSEAQLGSYTRYLVNQLQAELFQQEQSRSGGIYQDDKYYYMRWEEKKSSLKMIPAALRGDPAASAYQVIRRYRPLLGETVMSDLDRIGQHIRDGIKEFVFVDDFSGSGTQITDFLKSEIRIDGEEIPLYALPQKYPEIKISILLYVLHKSAKTCLETYPSLHIKYVDLIDDRFNFINENSIFYKEESEERIHRIIDVICQKKQEILTEVPTYEKYRKYEQNIPIVFSHGCPNNALLLLFASTPSWKQLYKLGDKNDGTI